MYFMKGFNSAEPDNVDILMSWNKDKKFFISKYHQQFSNDDWCEELKI